MQCSTQRSYIGHVAFGIALFDVGIGEYKSFYVAIGPTQTIYPPSRLACGEHCTHVCTLLL